MPRTPKPLQELLKRRKELLRAENNLSKAIANYSIAKNKLLSHHTHQPLSVPHTLPTEHSLAKHLKPFSQPLPPQNTTPIPKRTLKNLK